MALTDQEIKAILIREKKRKRRRKRIRRRLTLLAVLLLLIGLGIYVLAHQDAPGLSILFHNRGTICIDAGHGGDDPGSEALGRVEKDDTLKLAEEVRADLRDKGFRVIMTRTSDVTVDRPERGRIANNHKAELFVSIHRNKAEDERAEGVEVYIPSDGNLQSMLLAAGLLDALVEQGFQERSIQTGTLYDPADDYDENKYSEMPSCLIEVGFISNEGDNTRFDENFEKNALAMADAIEATYQDLYETESTESTEEL